MKAAWYDRYGSADVVDIRDVAVPEIGADEILVKVHSSSVTTADWRLRASAFPSAFWFPARIVFGLFAPKKNVLGGDFAGRVAAVGRSVTRFVEGDAVFGFSVPGAHAEYLATRADGAVAAKPECLSFDQAAAVPFGGLSALVFLRDFAGLKPGEKVLVVGASGGVGVFATQLAKLMGAEVTGVCGAANHDLVRALGADHVIDYRTDDFTMENVRYDVIIDTVGATSFRACKKVLARTGRYVPLEFGLREVWQSLVTRSSGKHVMIGVSGDNQADVEYLGELLQRRDIRAVIDQCLPLGRIVEAYRRVESRHKTGAMVISVLSSADVGEKVA